MTIVGGLKRKSTVTIPFETHTRTYEQISENNLIDDAANLMRKPQGKDSHLIIPPLGIYDIIICILKLIYSKENLLNLEYCKYYDVIKPGYWLTVRRLTFKFRIEDNHK